ncbi:MAG: hypothetical protein HWD61_06705 [Parachlamydiaceae bacterium]|nr:MAG: hypothetical protein HWD61_06705 [Parachlamydiaceae bacterium]
MSYQESQEPINDQFEEHRSTSENDHYLQLFEEITNEPDLGWNVVEKRSEEEANEKVDSLIILQQKEDSGPINETNQAVDEIVTAINQDYKTTQTAEKQKIMWTLWFQVKKKPNRI